jgi:hypothetical protein
MAKKRNHPKINSTDMRKLKAEISSLMEEYEYKSVNQLSEALGRHPNYLYQCMTANRPITIRNFERLMAELKSLHNGGSHTNENGVIAVKPKRTRSADVPQEKQTARRLSTDDIRRRVQAEMALQQIADALRVLWGTLK